MFNWADWLILAVLVVSSLISLKRGFVKEALSLAIWLFAFMIAVWFASAVAPRLAPWIEQPSLRQLAAFAALFIGTLIAGSMIGYLVSGLVKATGLSGTDRFLGVLFGFVRGLVIVMAFVIYAPELVDFTQDSWWQQSILIPFFQNFEDSFRSTARAVYDLITNAVWGK